MKTKSPRLSVNKLAEYAIADIIRRRQIVKDAKKPQPFIEARYSDARIGIKDYFISGYDEAIIVKAITAIKMKPQVSEYQINDVKNSITGLRYVLSAELPKFENCTISEFDEKNILLNIEGLDISVYPDLIIRNNDNGKIGGLKIHLSKTHDLSEGLFYVSTILKYFFMNTGYNEKEIDDNLCISLDVFRGKYTTSPKSYKRTMQRISALCQEVVLWWNGI